MIKVQFDAYIDDQLFSPTVIEDVAFGPANLGIEGDELEARARAALASVGADHLAELAREAGFVSVDLRGDHLSMPHGPSSHRVILVARLV